MKRLSENRNRKSGKGRTTGPITSPTSLWENCGKTGGKTGAKLGTARMFSGLECGWNIGNMRAVPSFSEWDGIWKHARSGCPLSFKFRASRSDGFYPTFCSGGKPTRMAAASRRLGNRESVDSSNILNNNLSFSVNRNYDRSVSLFARWCFARTPLMLAEPHVY